MKVPFLIVTLLLSLLVGSSLGFLLTTYPSPEMPDEFIDLAIKEQSEFGLIDSAIIAKELQKFESQTLASERFLQEILLNRTNIPELTSYFHDRTAIVQRRLSDLPTPIVDSVEYNREISFTGSSYQIAASAFFEAARENYTTQEFLSFDPLNQVSDSAKTQILETAKLDHIFPSLYTSVPESKWIYFGSELGFTRNFPWTELPKSYDSRQESWYSSAATGAKDLVILLDKSGSMEGDRKAGAMNATLNIIEGLGGRDRFNIVGFSDRTSQFTDTLALSSEDKFEEVEDFLNSMISGGTTDYELAFETGLDILKDFGSSRRDPVIVFVTDGSPTIGATDNETIIQKIQELNIGVDAQFVLFGLGDNDASPLLSDISTALDGDFEFIANNSQIESAISNYENFLSLNQRAVLTWSLPRLDPRGQGLMLTVSYPVVYQNQLRGVLASDLSIESMVNFTKLLKTTDNSYSFVFDLAGTNIFHPNVDVKTATNEEIRQPIIDLEGPSDVDIFQTMLTRAQVDLGSTNIINYQGEDRVVSFSPIGNTSMVYGIVTPLQDFIPSEVYTKLGTININQYSFLPGVGLGIIGAMVIFLLRNRIAHEKPLVEKEVSQ